MRSALFAVTMLTFLQPLSRSVAPSSEEELDRSSTRVRFDGGLWLVDGRPANVVLVEHAATGARLSRTPLIGGRRHGVALR